MGGSFRPGSPPAWLGCTLPTLILSSLHRAGWASLCPHLHPTARNISAPFPKSSISDLSCRWLQRAAVVVNHTSYSARVRAFVVSLPLPSLRSPTRG